jgi:hypothetical protein
MERAENDRATGNAASTSDTIKLKPLRDSLKELEDSYELMRASRAAFRERLAAVAEKSGVHPAVIRAFVAARMADDAEKASAAADRARQLAIVFDEVGA